MTYYSDFPTVPIGGGNPYYKCKYCGRAVPEINGNLDKHRIDCKYRIDKLKELNKQKTYVYVVYSDDCNENDCGCYSESVDSIWFDKKKAEERANIRYRAHVDEQEVME